MLKTIRKAFHITIHNFILLQPVIIYLFILTFAVIPLKSLLQNIPLFIAVLVNIVLLTIALCCGLFGMVKKAICVYDENKSSNQKTFQNDIKLLKEFFPSVGEYFLSACGCFILFILLSAAYSFALIKIGISLFANTDVLFQIHNITTQTIEQQRAFISSLSTEQLLALNKYILFFSVGYFIFNLLILFYPAVLFFKTKNPLKCLLISFSCIFKKPAVTVGTCLYLSFTSFLVSALSVFENINLIFSLIVLFLTLVFISNYIVVIFLSYEEHFNSDNGSNIQREN